MTRSLEENPERRTFVNRNYPQTSTFQFCWREVPPSSSNPVMKILAIEKTGLLFVLIGA